ncbi:MAG: methyltransferase domain-containing protein [Pirellulaceae bacterium]|nr:methyltransferase domain-containing protein [Pirellulaceae bacterium]
MSKLNYLEMSRREKLAIAAKGISIDSPLVVGSCATQIATVDVQAICESYANLYNMDVRRFFDGMTSVGVYQCDASRLVFFHPHSTSGDSEFYEQLQQFPWYYMPWKWEHGIAESYVAEGLDLLEIGCAKGGFLKKLNGTMGKRVGLELNKAAQRDAIDDGVDVRCESVQSHSVSNVECYDIVCSFQVMEHIYELRSVLNASIAALKVGGKLIISVPNNHSFIKDLDNALNMPPHHMCLWEEDSLRSLQNYYPLKLEMIKFEPIQKYHYAHVIAAAINRNIRYEIFRKVLRRMSTVMRAHIFFGLFRRHIRGHSILAVYRKVELDRLR